MQVFDKYGVPTVRIGLSIVYLSCIYRICNVVDSGNSANYRRALKAQFRGRSQASYRLEVKGGEFPNSIRDNKQRKKNKRRLWTALVEDYCKINKVGKVFKVFKELKDIYGF